MWHQHNPDEYAVGSTVYVSAGRWDPEVTEYTVVKITPSKQIVAQRTLPGGTESVRINARGNIVGESGWSRSNVVSADTAAEIRAEAAKRAVWRQISDLGNRIEKAARAKDGPEVRSLLSALQQIAVALPPPAESP